MKLLILGASGATGRLVVEQALAAGHQVRALVRKTDGFPANHPELEVRIGQATDPGDVTAAMEGVDAVISTLGATKGTVITDATNSIIAGAGKTGVQRVVVMSSFAVLSDRLTRPAKTMAKLAMAAIVRDKVAAEDLLRRSDLDWTIVYAARLDNGPHTGAATVLPEDQAIGMRTTISRADVAAWLITAATDHTDSRRGVALAA